MIINSKTDEERIAAIFNLIDEKYLGDLQYYNKAAKEINAKYILHRQINDISDAVLSHDKSFITDVDKTTYIDFKNRMAYLEYVSKYQHAIGYTYDYLNVRRVLPFSLTTFLEKGRQKDHNKAKNTAAQDKVYKVFRWIKDKVLNRSFSLSNIGLDRKSGTLRYNTITKDHIGSYTQYITVKIDPNKIISIGDIGFNGKLIDISQSYQQLFNYFITFGYTEFYGKCTCNEYTTKHGKKLGISNYMCSHLLYSMAQLPYYATYFLANSNS